MQGQTASAKENNLPGPGYFSRARQSNNVYKVDKPFKLSNLQNLEADIYVPTYISVTCTSRFKVYYEIKLFICKLSCQIDIESF